MKNLSQDSQCPGQDSNHASTENMSSVFHYTNLLDLGLFLFSESIMEIATCKYFFFSNFLSTILLNDLDIYISFTLIGLL
jgi:hypothetical protein